MQLGEAGEGKELVSQETRVRLIRKGQLHRELSEPLETLPEGALLATLDVSDLARPKGVPTDGAVGPSSPQPASRTVPSGMRVALCAAGPCAATWTTAAP